MIKTLLIDIETSPLISYTWGIYEQDVIKRIQSYTILSVAYKWIGKSTQVLSIDRQTELSLLKKLHKLMNEADVIVAHNGDSFDIKKINARFIIYKINPPSPYRTIDTLKEAKKIAAFDSNSLNSLGIDMGEGEKVKHRGFDMWEGCMAGNKKDWADMRRYNKRDVDLLYKVYLRLRPFMKNHPDVRNEVLTNCPKCDSSNTQKRGMRRTLTRFYYRCQCLSCGGWFRGDIVNGLKPKKFR